MAVVYWIEVKRARMAAVREAINAGAGPGRLEIGTRDFSKTLLRLELPKAGIEVLPEGDLLLNAGELEAVVLSDGKAAEGRIVDSMGRTIISELTVGGASAQIQISPAALLAGQTLRLKPGKITHS